MIILKFYEGLPMCWVHISVNKPSKVQVLMLSPFYR